MRYDLNIKYADGETEKRQMKDWDALACYLLGSGVSEDAEIGDEGTAAGNAGRTFTWAPTPPTVYDFLLTTTDADGLIGEIQLASHWTLREISAAMGSGEGIPVTFTLAGVDGIVNPAHVVHVSHSVTAS